MMLTALGCRDIGVASFGNVHDSFSVHANGVNDLIRIAKEKWIEMYGGDNQLELMKHNILSNADGFETETPKLGNLNVQDVMKSDYFFA